MKKIIAIISLALIAVMLAAALCACGGKNDNSIVGTWRSTKESDIMETLDFKSDGTVLHSDQYSNDTYNYTANDGKLTISTSRQGEKFTETGTYSINGDTLTIKWDDGYTITYTKQ